MAVLTVAGLLLAGCSPAEAPPDTQTTHATARSVNLAGLADLKDDFPSGFTPEMSGQSKVDAKWAHLVGDTVSFGEPFTVDPPECRALLKPVEAGADADKAGIGAGGPQPPALTVGVTTPVSVPVPLPARNCDRMTFEVEGAVADGTVERLPAPTIDSAATYGLKVTHDDVAFEYFYIAILDDRTYVVVRARMAPDFQPEPLLPDLLTKAVTAIRN